MRYDGINFTIVDTTEGGLSGLGTDGGMRLLKNGKLLVHVYRPGVSTLYENNLNIYDTQNGDTKTIQTLYNPHSLHETDKFKYGVYVNDIYEDNENNVWFSFESGLQDDAGAVVWKKDNNWDVLKLPMRPNNFRQDRPGDSAYYPASAITQDKLGRLWVGGAIILNKLNSDLTIRQFDSIDIFNNLTVFTNKYTPSDTYYDVDSIVKYLSDITCNCLVNNLNYIHPSRVSCMETTEDGSTWFVVDGLGVVRYKPSQVGVGDTQQESEHPFTVRSSGDNIITLVMNRPISLEGIALYDITGRRVYSENFGTDTAMQQEIKLPNSIVGGVYVVAVNNKDKSFFRKIFIH